MAMASKRKKVVENDLNWTWTTTTIPTTLQKDGDIEIPIKTGPGVLKEEYIVKEQADIYEKAHEKIYASAFDGSATLKSFFGLEEFKEKSPDDIEVIKPTFSIDEQLSEYEEAIEISEALEESERAEQESHGKKAYEKVKENIISINIRDLQSTAFNLFKGDKSYSTKLSAFLAGVQVMYKLFKNKLNEKDEKPKK